MGPKKKGNVKRKDDKDKAKGNKEEVKKPAEEEEPMPDYDWLPKKRKPKEEGPKEPVDDGLWLWPGDSKGKPIHSETFWSSGRPPRTPPQEPIRKPLKETDKGWCFLKDGPFIKTRPPSRCVEHGVVGELEAPGAIEIEKNAKKGWCHDSCTNPEQETVAECPQHGHAHPSIFVKVLAHALTMLSFHGYCLNVTLEKIMKSCPT